jgi:hypothetical protein
MDMDMDTDEDRLFTLYVNTELLVCLLVCCSHLMLVLYAFVAKLNGNSILI